MLRELSTWATSHPWIVIGLAVASAFVSVVLVCVAAVRIPPDYFTCEERPLPCAGRPAWLRLGVRVFLNLVGAGLIVAGIVMSVPGVPGQGLLTILLGVMLVDIPGKRRLERAMVRLPAVHAGLNRVRARFGRPAIEVP